MSMEENKYGDKVCRHGELAWYHKMREWSDTVSEEEYFYSIVFNLFIDVLVIDFMAYVTRFVIYFFISFHYFNLFCLMKTHWLSIYV